MKKYHKLSLQIQQELLSEFCEALLNLKTTNEAVKFLTDLLTKSEAIMLAKRIRIAKLLIEGRNYREIENSVKVSHGTITKVAQWLAEAGEGFRMISRRIKKGKPKPETSFDLAMKDWKRFKRHFPIMFWPQLLIEGILKSADKRQKKEIYQAIRQLDHKSRLYKQINEVLKKEL
ncbi:MAG: hypothetical protein COT36_03970 [Parcubacteria group bacterium CG08_land_8_20_14_0_20_38_56]|nr:MAG: hypothetical protein COT36_03970 [Parcubacteria group bacterium CG08_land_8_20_14_0_20_38_56]